jgi:hypothetical protein
MLGLRDIGESLPGRHGATGSQKYTKLQLNILSCCSSKRFSVAGRSAGYPEKFQWLCRCPARHHKGSLASVIDGDVGWNISKAME